MDISTMWDIIVHEYGIATEEELSLVFSIPKTSHLLLIFIYSNIITPPKMLCYYNRFLCAGLSSFALF